MNYLNKICLIGGGASNIAVARGFKKAGLECFDIIEKQDDFGGNWYFGTTGANVYQSAHLISDKLTTQFAEDPMPADYPDYPSHRQMLAYLRQIAQKYNLYTHTQFNTSVEKVERKGETWQVTLSSGESRKYGMVVVGNGRHQQSIMPSYPGTFTGKMIHSKHYSHADILRGQRVLVIGAGNSGCDIVIDAVHYADKVFHSTRRPYHYIPKFIDGMTYQTWMRKAAQEAGNQMDFLKHFEKTIKLAGYDPSDYGLAKPKYRIDQCHPIINSLLLYYIGHGDICSKADVKGFENKTVHFSDGSSAEIDVIICATGCNVDFPFLSDEIVEWNEKRLPNTFLRTFHKNYSNLAFVGFINTASGFGILGNILGRSLAAYAKAWLADTPNYNTFLRMAKGPNPDMGNSQFLDTERHKYEVDQWKFLNVLKSAAVKLEQG